MTSREFFSFTRTLSPAEVLVLGQRLGARSGSTHSSPRDADATSPVLPDGAANSNAVESVGIDSAAPFSH